MQLIRKTSCLIVGILVIATLESGMVHGQQQITDTLTSLFSGLRGTLNSLLGGGRAVGMRRGYYQPEQEGGAMQNGLFDLPADRFIRAIPQQPNDGDDLLMSVGPSQMDPPQMRGWRGPTGGYYRPSGPMGAGGGGGAGGGPLPEQQARVGWPLWAPMSWYGQQQQRQSSNRQPSSSTDSQSGTGNEYPSSQNLNQLPQNRRQQQQQNSQETIPVSVPVTPVSV